MFDDFELEEPEDQFQIRKRKQPKPRRQRRRRHAQILAELTERTENSRTGWSGISYPSGGNIPKVNEQTSGTRQGFSPTFSSSRHEREWILTYLGPFYEDHIITDVLRQVKGGKEATVYCCRAHPSTGVKFIAAKVYRPRIFRTLKNDALYRQARDILDAEGKKVRGRRERLAMKKKSEFGQELLHTAWLANEFQMLRALYQAGADVPKPFAHSDNALLLEYLGDERMPAPTLNRVALSRNEAQPLFDRLMRNVERMLAHHCVHADLSAFNVLYWRGVIKIIDLPQAVDPYVNPNAFMLFVRDVKRLCQYFAQYGVAADATALATELWEKYVLTVPTQPAR